MNNPLFSVDALTSFTLAILLLFCGKAIVQKSPLLQRYCIPEPVIGGLLCAAVVSGAYFGLGVQINFDLEVRDTLLLYFFAGIGLKSDIRSLASGGKPLLILLLLATVYIVLQNLLGMGVAHWFDVDPRAGLMLGSISLTGGVGTTLAWAPIFVDDFGIGNARELGIASNTVGIIAACVIGGPIAHALIRRHRLHTAHDDALEVGELTDHSTGATMHYYDVLWAWMWLNLALMVGHGFSTLFVHSGILLPEFVGCLLAGIMIRAVVQAVAGPQRLLRWSGARHGLALISDICLGMFLTMALMGLQLWQLNGILTFILTALVLQIALSIVYTVVLVFNSLGRNYEATVMAAGFSGITLGSTATAIVNMTAVTQKYGAAHQAFIVVPLVCGFFIDLVNALLIGMTLKLL